MVDSAAVDVEVLTQVLHAHGAALKVPAGVAFSPWGIPDHGMVLELGLGEPEHKVMGVTLVAVHLYAGACLEALPVQEGQLAVVRELVDGEIDVAARFVGVALLFQGLYQVNHLLDVVGGLACYCRADYVEPVGVVEERLGVELGYLIDSLACGLGALLHLVLALVGIGCQMAYIGDVHHVLYLVAQVCQGALEEVLEDICPEVSDMSIIIDGRAAAVEAYLARLDWYKVLYLPSHGVE